MSNVLKMSDIVDIGIQKEKARRDFYDLVSKSFEDKELKDIFIKLRDWEEDHIQRFQMIREELNEPKSVESYEGEMEAYMRSLVDDALYNEVSPDTFNQNVSSPIEAIRYGIQFEKDAILFFMEVGQYVQDSKKDVISKLLEEERQHIVYLINLRKRIISS